MQVHGSVMLVLSRKLDESIIIADDIRVVVLGINGKQVRLGIDAPNEVSVHRSEVYEQIMNNQTAQAEPTKK